MSWSFTLPTGPKPRWEGNNSQDGTPLNSVAESFVIHQSLRHSRNAWLTEIFPKFSSKGKGRHAESIKPPPHTLRFLAKCHVEIGPHTFHDTSFFEATYLPKNDLNSIATYQGPAATSTYGRQSYGNLGSTSIGPPSVPAPAASSSFESSVDVTPQLISQVNDAANRDPHLQSLLQQAAMGLASLEQLQALGVLIQNLAAEHRRTEQAVAGSSAQTPAQIASLPHASNDIRTDIIIEFRENQSDRFILPHKISACTKEIPNLSVASRININIYFFVPFKKPEGEPDADPKSSEQTPAIISIKTANDNLWNALSARIGSVPLKPDAVKRFKAKVSKKAKRVYLQHRLPQGDLLSQLKNAASATNGYTMKSIKPSPAAESSKPKRVRSRKPTQKRAQTTNTVASTSTATNGQAQSLAPEPVVPATQPQNSASSTRKLAPGEMQLTFLPDRPQITPVVTVTQPGIPANHSPLHTPNGQ